MDFGRFAHIVDVGGGDGTLLAGILGKYPSATGTLFDLPHVATRAKAVLANAGMDGRAKVVRGDFFESLPGGGNLYLLKNVLHDWQDPEAIKILRCCRSAMANGSTLIFVERIVDSAADADAWPRVPNPTVLTRTVPKQIAGRAEAWPKLSTMRRSPPA